MHSDNDFQSICLSNEQIVQMLHLVYTVFLCVLLVRVKSYMRGLPLLIFYLNKNEYLIL